jgi:hypothetical protein
MNTSGKHCRWANQNKIGKGVRNQDGAATLVIVLMLFFVVSLVAAYTSRNLIFEQRTAVNQYRASLAFETAEAGLEWAVALLNGGRIGEDCTEASATPTSTSFRERYLTINPATGMVSATALAPSLLPSCIWSGSYWRCYCPTTTTPTFAAIPGGGVHPAFRLQFVSGPGTTTSRAGMIRLEVNACVNVNSPPNPLPQNNLCLNDFSDAPVDSEARAQHTAILALKSALTTPPAAALTVLGDVTLSPTLIAVNTDVSHGGLTVHAAGVLGPPNVNIDNLRGPAGTPSARTLVVEDNTLVPDGLTRQDLNSSPPVQLNRDRAFASFFGVLPNTHRNQPAAVVISCPVSGCRQLLADTVDRNPGRVIWIDGDLVLESAGAVGSLSNPASIVVNGIVRVTNPGAGIVGIVYVRGLIPSPSNEAWQGGGSVRGALITETALTTNATATIEFDRAVMDTVRRTHGSFVRVPGGWRDYKS